MEIEEILAMGTVAFVLLVFWAICGVLELVCGPTDGGLPE